MKYYYDENGKYLSANNTGEKAPEKAAGFNKLKPGHAGMTFDDAADCWVEPEQINRKVHDVPKAADSYAIKVAGYDLTRTKSALRFVKNPAKKAILTARLAKLIDG